MSKDSHDKESVNRTDALVTNALYTHSLTVTASTTSKALIKTIRSTLNPLNFFSVLMHTGSYKV